MFLKPIHTAIFGVLYLASSYGYGFESSKVLPKGVRQLSLKNARTTIDQKTDSTGLKHSLARPLSKDLTFANVLNSETGVKKSSLHAFLNTEGFALNDSLGSFVADMQGKMDVLVPMLSYGITDRWTLALAAPYYRAKMGISLGFKPNLTTANAFISRLHDPGYNQTASAQEVSDKINNAILVLQNKLQANNFNTLQDWSGEGFGDMVLASKYLAYQSDLFAAAITNGLVMPTAQKVQDSDNLIAIPFGDKTWDFFTALAFDEPLREDLFVNQYIKYTYQGYGRRDLRLASEEEAIAVSKASSRYKIGDKLEAGLSLQYEPAYGLIAGTGYHAIKKYHDRYFVEASPTVKAHLEKNTNEIAHFAETKIGYTSVPSFKRGEFAVPFMINLEYKKHLANKYFVSHNSVASDLITADMNLFF